MNNTQSQQAKAKTGSCGPYTPGAKPPCNISNGLLADIRDVLLCRTTLRVWSWLRRRLSRDTAAA